MKLAIDKNVPIPAYQQVVEGIAGAIARGDLARGARLPSVRNLALDLGLNVNTVARAYRDLERAGVVDTMPGMGTFVAAPATGRPGFSSGRGSGRPSSVVRVIPATGGPWNAAHAGAPIATSWRDLLAAAHALAVADGVEAQEFIGHVTEIARVPSEGTPLLVAASTRAEAADLLRTLPTGIVPLTTTCDVESLSEKIAERRVTAILTSFPAQARVRARLGDRASDLTLVPLETEFTEATVKALTALPPSARLALVTVEKDRWDEEANDVMKIIGRSRWLKMVILDAGDRGLAERLEHVDAVLCVPRAREAVQGAERPGHAIVELARQLTVRTRERLDQLVG